MQWGDFRSLFRGIAWKRLTPHEVVASVSNGHEFQGVGRLRDLLGTEPIGRLPTTYFLLDDSEEIDVLESWASWYDSRINQPSRSPEWRLYYPAEAGAIQSKMAPGDLMVLAVTNDNRLRILLARKGSDRERELEVLFGLNEDSHERIQVRSFVDPLAIDLISATLLEKLGIELPVMPVGDGADIVADIIDILEADYPERLPPGKTIAALVRDNVEHIDALEAPDETLFKWVETEAAVFRGWEDKKIGRRIIQGFLDSDGSADVDAFRAFSMALRQSRVSRAGGALQYHMATLLTEWDIPFAVEPIVDGGESPDFLFPSREAYEDGAFNPSHLRMLAAKYTAKDRWRQVLNEAERIPTKHLLTLEATISKRQLALMTRASLTPVIPLPLQVRYTAQARPSLMSIREFLLELRILCQLWK